MLVHRPLFLSLFLPGLVLLTIMVGLATPAISWAQAVEVQAHQQLALLGPRAKQQQASSAAEAAKIAKRRYGGKILKVDTVKTGDGIRYRVKLLQESGRVKTVVIKG